MVNPTPFDVSIEWHAGRTINVPADSFIYLDNDQIQDFTEGQPGSEAIRSLTRHLGVFVQTDDRSYEVQALEALKSSAESKAVQVRGFMQNARKELRELNLTEADDAFQEYVDSHGYGDKGLRGQVETLKKRVRWLQTKVDEQLAEGKSLRAQWDVTRTIMAVDPPREFPTPVQMELFLFENPDIARLHNAWKVAQEKAEAAGTTDG